jgi:hypothetical protein
MIVELVTILIAEVEIRAATLILATLILAVIVVVIALPVRLSRRNPAVSRRRIVPVASWRPLCNRHTCEP